MARASAKSTRPKNKVSVNFKGVESRTLYPEDDYRVALDRIVSSTSGAGNEQLEFHFKITDGKFEGKSLSVYCPLTENSLWKLHGLLSALGIDVPDDEMDLDFEEIVSEANEIMAVVQHEIYDGNKRSKMMDWYPIDDEDPEPAAKGKQSKDADDEPAPKAKKGKKAPAKIARDTVEDMDRDELEALIDEHGLDVDPDDFKKTPKLLEAILEELEEKEMLEADEPEEPEEPKGRKGKAAEEPEMTDAEKRKARREARKAKAEPAASKKSKVADEEEEPAPKKGAAKGKKKAPEGVTSDSVMEADEDGLQEIIDEHDLEVDLDDYKTLRKKASAVIDALEDAGLLED